MPSLTAPDTDLPTIEIDAGLPGFPEHRSFVLVRLDQAGLLFSLRSLDDESLRFLVVPPVPFFPDYAPEVTDETARQLALTDPADALVLLVVTPGERPEDATANLFAPIVVNQRTRAGAQVVLTGTHNPLRAPLRAA